MFGGKKKLYAEGAQTEGLVVHIGESKEPGWYWYTVRAKLPDGSTTDIKATNDGFALDMGEVVPCRYDPANHSKVVLDVPVLQERYNQAQAAQQAQFDAQLAGMGEPGSAAPGAPAGGQVLAGSGDLGNLKEQLLQMAAQNPGSVIDLRSSQPPAEHASDPVDRLAKLADLKERGVLSEAEFAAEKAKILGES